MVDMRLCDRKMCMIELGTVCLGYIFAYVSITYYYHVWPGFSCTVYVLSNAIAAM